VSVTAFLDANVLYPATLRSVFIYLAAADTFRALWSNAVSEEWMAALARDRPDLSSSAIARVRALMEAHVEHAVVSGYEALIPQLALPDPDDRHVLAAAIHGGAHIIVTANIKDFPPDALAPYKLTAQEPDDFIRALLEADPESAVAAFAADRARLRNPAMTPAEYITSLGRAGLTHTTAVLWAYVDAL
jgi:predicted nucleic acid-binding protein